MNVSGGWAIYIKRLMIDTDNGQYKRGCVVFLVCLLHFFNLSKFPSSNNHYKSFKLEEKKQDPGAIFG